MLPRFHPPQRRGGMFAPVPTPVPRVGVGSVPGAATYVVGPRKSVIVSRNRAGGVLVTRRRVPGVITARPKID